jgi:hypothetical protein
VKKETAATASRLLSIKTLRGSNDRFAAEIAAKTATTLTTSASGTPLTCGDVGL